MSRLMTLDREDEELFMEEEDDLQNHYLTFSLGCEHYGLSITEVKEILEYEEVTPIPMMPEFIQGVINLRGKVVPVIDLNRRLHNVGSEVSRRTCILIAEVEFEGEHMEVGLVVDAVNEALIIPKDDINPAPSFGVEISTAFIKGMAKLQDKFVILLNIEKTLPAEQWQTIEEIQQQT